MCTCNGYGYSSGTIFGGGVTQLSITPLITVPSTGGWQACAALVQVVNKNVNMTIAFSGGNVIAAKLE